MNSTSQCNSVKNGLTFPWSHQSLQELNKCWIRNIDMVRAHYPARFFLLSPSLCFLDYILVDSLARGLCTYSPGDGDGPK